MPASRRRLGRIAAAARRLAGSSDGLHRCPDCGTSFVCPIDWEAAGEEHWQIQLRCGACGAAREVRVTNEEAKAFDLALDRQTAEIERALARIDRERMEAELDALVAALDRDLIDAADFAPVSASAIEIDGLRVIRGGRVVVPELGVRVEAGPVAGLLGPSGCGKTTLMRAIVGVQRIERGRVLVLGAPAGSPALRSRIAYRPQAASVYADLTVEENLRYFARIAGTGGARIAEVLETVGLAALRRQVVGSLSGGERARVSLAVALLGRPELLVLDEPTVGLDPVLRAELWAGFRRLAEDGATLLISSHVMDEAAECDALLLMRDGAILEQTTPAALRRHTGEPDLGRAFLAVIREAA